MKCIVSNILINYLDRNRIVISIQRSQSALDKYITS